MPPPLSNALLQLRWPLRPARGARIETDETNCVPTVALHGNRTLVPLPDTEVFPRVQTVFQQLHNYPVGASGKESAAACKGNKDNITPVRREFLSDVRAVIAVRSSEDFENRICQGLAGELNSGRYRVPFLGDNSFLPDRLEVLKAPVPVRWFERVTASANGIQDHSARLTMTIDRVDLSQTSSALFAPAETSDSTPGEAAWVKDGG